MVPNHQCVEVIKIAFNSFRYEGTLDKDDLTMLATYNIGPISISVKGM